MQQKILNLAIIKSNDILRLEDNQGVHYCIVSQCELINSSLFKRPIREDLQERIQREKCYLLKMVSFNDAMTKWALKLLRTTDSEFINIVNPDYKVAIYASNIEEVESYLLKVSSERINEIRKKADEEIVAINKKFEGLIENTNKESIQHALKKFT